MRNIKFFSLFLFILFCVSCAPRESSPAAGPKTYQQDFQCKEALFIRKRNGEPTVMASAFLVDKKRGLFASAKHFVGNESDGDCKIFFNGRVYDGFLVRLPPITDVAVIKIDGKFDSSSFPEPYILATDIKVGEKIFVRGIHPHPTVLQKDKIVLPIYENYYVLLGTGNEFVYDSLEGRLVDLRVLIKNEQIKGSSELLAKVVNSYLGLETTLEHKLSPDRGFGGLSGGPTINERGEVVGVNSNEIQEHYIRSGQKFVRFPWKTLRLVPASELRDLLAQLGDIR